MPRSSDVRDPARGARWTHAHQPRNRPAARRGAAQRPPHGRPRPVEPPPLDRHPAGRRPRPPPPVIPARAGPYPGGMLVGRTGLSPVMVGRAAELDRLSGLVGARPEPTVALVAGEAGIGKI